jgi:putative aldouronate transport system permease protein
MFFSGGLIPTYIIVKGVGLYDNFWVLILPKAINVYNLILMKSFFENTIPRELEEAAIIDGCSNTGILLRVVLPLSKAIIAVMIIFYGVSHWNGFFTALIYLEDKAKFPLQLVIREILIQDSKSLVTDETLLAQQLMSEGIKYALIVVASVPFLILYPFLQKFFVKGVMIGAIKG